MLECSVYIDVGDKVPNPQRKIGLLHDWAPLAENDTVAKVLQSGSYLRFTKDCTQTVVIKCGLRTKTGY
jgi:hypothetical protein